MFQSLKMDSYLDGYNAFNVNCMDIPIAGAAGCYNYDNYYYYCFYYTMLNNWGNDFINNSWLNARNQILSKLGLVMRANTAESNSELISLIKTHIDNMHPLILLARYNTLFYHPLYLNHRYKGSHGIVISDYDTERPIYIIREGSHLIGELTKPFRGQPLYRFQISEDILLDIWTKSNIGYKEDNSEHYNIIYSIEKVCNSKISTYINLIDDLVGCYTNQNNLISVVNSFDSQIDRFKDSSFIEYLRRTLHGSMIVIFEALEKAFQISLQENQNSSRFKYLKDKYIEFRYLVISKLHAQALKGKSIGDEKRNKMISEIHSLDNELFSLIKHLYNVYEEDHVLMKNQHSVAKKNQLVNFALGAKSSADSEFKLIVTGVHYKASKAFNGKWEKPTEDMWMSNASKPIHWLKVDLGQSRTVNRFVIRHFANPNNLITVDFKIQGSNNSRVWTDLVVVKGNNSDTTIHEVLPSTYRYFRLYITNPGMASYSAKIYEFEVWGMI